MRTLPKDGGSSSSIWVDADVPRFDTTPDAETDICVIGAGIAGLTTAFELARRGVRVSVLDDGPIGGGETGRTSAHLASAVDDHYATLEQRFGAEGARMVAESHATAIDYIEAMVRELGIACDFQRVDGYLFAPAGERDDRHFLERELAAAQRAGLGCELVPRAPLPFDTGPAICFHDQAQFHPIQYLRAIADAVVQHGGQIHTGVHVASVKAGRPLHVNLATGRTLLARAVVDATNGAFTSHVFLPLRQAAYRTYVIAFAIPSGVVPAALFWETSDPYHYLRITRGLNGEDVLLVGGNDHRTGHGEPDAQWRSLENWSRRWIPQVGRVVARWSGQILEPADDLAHIGPSPDLEHVYVATGDSGNGLTHGTIAGLMLPEMMHGQHPRWERIYAPNRNHLHGATTLLKEVVQSSVPYTDWLRSGDVQSLDAVPHGEGAIVRRGLHMVAAYRDEAGGCHLMSATCPHLRGVVHWNAAEKTWDCPCHGSRFDRYGRVVNGPAAADLAPLEAPAHEHEPARVRSRWAERGRRELDLEPVPVMPIERER